MSNDTLFKQMVFVCQIVIFKFRKSKLKLESKIMKTTVIKTNQKKESVVTMNVDEDK